MTKPKENLIGRRFDRLTVISQADDYIYPNGKRRTRWVCKCDCGKVISAEQYSLKRGRIKSCGCLNIDMIKARSIRHGGRHERLYGVWINMKTRCHNPNSNSYSDYGGRGIAICDEWDNSYSNFRAWALSNGYDENADNFACTLDRIDPNGDYCPENCRWVNAVKQANNRRNTIMIEFNNQLHSLSEWADIIGVKYHTLFARIYKLGWSLEKALVK